MTGSSLVLLAHGTGDATGRRTLGALLVRLRSRLPGTEVRLAYAGVARPGLADVLARRGGEVVGDTQRSGAGPSVVVPAFLAAGYHVRVDVPGQLADIGRSDVTLADPLGPDPALIDVALELARAAGADPARDRLVLAAAGSTDPAAQDDLVTAASLLSARVGSEVPVGNIAGGEPTVASVVAGLGGRVALVTWLLAPGAFHRRLADAGAHVVGAPLGDHPGVADVVVQRYRAACLVRG